MDLKVNLYWLIGALTLCYRFPSQLQSTYRRIGKVHNYFHFLFSLFANLRTKVLIYWICLISPLLYRYLSNFKQLLYNCSWSWELMMEYWFHFELFFVFISSVFESEI